MRNPPKFTDRRRRIGIKRLLPSNLFSRALLILVLPMVLSQLVIAHIFYDRHWSSVSRNMANAVVGDISWLYKNYSEAIEEGIPATEALSKSKKLSGQLLMGVELEPRAQRPLKDRGKAEFPELYRGLSERIQQPIAIQNSDESGIVRVRIFTNNGALNIAVSRKALTSPTTMIFMLWMVGTSMLLTLIATLFLRNQVRPIVQLAQVAEQLGLGQEVGNFKPTGANEVRRAGRAFMVMSERIRRHVQNRTEMLAGISHDLRTPLTRMKLELELATMDAVTRAAISSDIDEMGRMIDEYLDFARGDAGEIPEPIEVRALLADIVADYQRSKRHVDFHRQSSASRLMLRPQAIRRALTNLIDNALRYGGGAAHLTLEQSATFVRIKVTDIGPGIAEAEHETVFKPFTRLEPSRNTQTGGVGLGLSIARAVAQSHGGDVTLENQRDELGKVTGLEVTIRLPRAVQPAQ